MTELTEEIQRDPGRFLKHVDLSDVETEEEFKAKLESDLPNRTKWRHPATGELFDVDRTKHKQRIIDRADIFFEVRAVQETVISNVRSRLESAVNFEDLDRIEISEKKFPIKDTFNQLTRIKAKKAKQEAFEERVKIRREEFFGDVTRGDIERAKYRRVSAVAGFYRVSEEEATERLENLGFTIDGGNIR